MDILEHLYCGVQIVHRIYSFQDTLPERAFTIAQISTGIVIEMLFLFYLP